LNDDSQQFNERIAQLVANAGTDGLDSCELSQSLQNKQDQDGFLAESSRQDHTLQLSGDLLT